MHSTGEKKEENLKWRLIWARSDTVLTVKERQGEKLQPNLTSMWKPRKDNSHEQPKSSIGRETRTQCHGG